MPRSELSRRPSCQHACVLTLLAALAMARPAAAAFPGKNGLIVYGANGPFGNKLFLTDGRQLTTGEPYDFDPTFSPDGTKIAFLRQFLFDGSYSYVLTTMNTDGTGLRFLMDSSTSFPGIRSFRSVTSPAWSRDGQQISFAVRNGTQQQNGIWTIAASGGAPTRTVAENYATSVSASPLGGEFVYPCNFRLGELGTSKLDLCIYDELTNRTKQLPIDWPGAGDSAATSPRWMPDGERIVFSLGWATQENGHSVGRFDVFMINANGTGLRKVTDSGPDVCPGLEFDVSTQATHDFAEPRPSPDGASILVWRRTNFDSNPPDCEPVSFPTPSIGGKDHGLYTVPANGGAATLVVGNKIGLAQPSDWQPIPADLTVILDDGHGHPLDQVKVEIRDPHTKGIVLANPEHNGDGTYVFKDAPPGDWLVRTTLVDTPPDPEPSAFEIWHAPGPAAAAWADHDVTVEPKGGTIVYRSFDLTATLTDTNVPASDRERLDDMAAIYYHLQRYVAWVKRTLTPQTGTKVIVHTFADFDPTDGTPFYSPFGALYSAGDPAKIVLGTEFSRYEFRDGAYDDEFGDEAPENGEWHEYNHHLWFTFVDTAAACVGENHAGYLNPDTCDSMLEGFANFLAAAAARDIDGATDSFYDGSWNLEAPLKAWSSYIHSDGTRIYEEDVAVAALLWDLHDDAPDKFPTAVIEEETGLHVEATYTDEHSESLVDLWARFTSAKPLTVDDLRVSYGTPDLSIDLDGDEFNDIAPIDQVFLMHGFFPIDHDETITSSHKTYHYDVNYVQRTAPTAARNAVVGWSSHRIFAANGSVLNTFIPRSHMPMDRNANVAVDIRDASGTPLGGAQLDVVIDYPGQQQNTSTRALAGGAGNLVSLRLPPYFDHLLPEDALPPPCDPATDQTVTVTLRAAVNDYVSADSPSFDNCEYAQAVAAGAGTAALAFTLTFPEDSTPPESAIDTAPTDTMVGDATSGFWRVRLACDDPEDGGFASGCARLEYRLDEGPVTEYRGTVPVIGVGTHTVEWRGIDAAGNAEAFQTVSLEIVPPLPPTIEGFAPASGPVGTAVTITGTNLDDVTSVTFNGVAASLTIVSPAELSATVPAGATTGPIAVTGPGGTATSASDFVVGDPPSVTDFSPSSGGVGTVVNVTGTRFDTATAVAFNGTSASFTIVSATQVRATVPAGATSGPIAVTNPDGTGTSVSSFSVLPTPTITGFSPGSGPQGTSVTITGTNLDGATFVGFGPNAATFTVGSSTEITAIVPASAFTSRIVVVTPAGTAQSATEFIVFFGPTPTITSVSPTSGAVGTAVTIKGTNLGLAAEVRFNGVLATFRMKGAAISATVPAGATTGPITVMTGGGMTGSSPQPFVVDQPPAISGFSPTSGPGGSTVTITGARFTGATAVKVGSSSAKFTVVSATTISATVAKGAKSGPISVTTPGGTATSAGSFTVTK